MVLLFLRHKIKSVYKTINSMIPRNDGDLVRLYAYFGRRVGSFDFNRVLVSGRLSVPDRHRRRVVPCDVGTKDSSRAPGVQHVFFSINNPLAEARIRSRRKGP